MNEMIKKVDSTKCPTDIDQRVALSLSLQRYLRASAEFETASQAFTDASNSLRNDLPRDGRFVAQFSFRHYLVTSDRDGNFDVERIETL
jgi:hypothetical protein